MIFSSRFFGRALLSSMFLVAALNKLQNWDSAVQYMAGTMEANGFGLNALGLDDAGLVPMLMGAF